MALSTVEQVYQEAVDLIGEHQLTDTSPTGQKPYSTCAIHYPRARDEIIRGYAWNEATELALCLQDSTTPAHTWTYRFLKPSDCLRIITTSRPKQKWRVIGNYIYTDYKYTPGSYTVGTSYTAGQYLSYSSVTYQVTAAFTATSWAADASKCTSKGGDYGYIEVEYAKQLSDPTTWSAQLRQAIVLNLATKIVIPITSDYQRRTSLLEELWKMVLPHAFALDAIEGKPKQFFYSDFIDSRGEA